MTGNTAGRRGGVVERLGGEENKGNMEMVRKNKEREGRLWGLGAGKGWE